MEAQRFPPAWGDDHAINLKANAPSILDCKIYPLNLTETDALAKWIKEHLDKSYIHLSKSPYAAPFFLIKKKDGTLRPIQDYQALNAWTIWDVYPLLDITSLTWNLAGKCLFTRFDVRWGYHNVHIRDRDQWKAAFKMPLGLFEPMVMLFGQCNTPATFQWVMDHILRPLKLKYPYMIFVYMDNILITTPNDPTLHQWIVHDVLDVLEWESFFLKPQKCTFKQTHVEYLGLLLDGETLHIDPSKIASIAKWPHILKSVKEVWSTLSVLGYHHTFIPGFTDIAQPLLNLLKKGVPFIWTPECTAALNHLITLTTTDPVLWQPDHNKPFKLEVDASQ